MYVYADCVIIVYIRIIKVSFFMSHHTFPVHCNLLTSTSHQQSMCSIKPLACIPYFWASVMCSARAQLLVFAFMCARVCHIFSLFACLYACFLQYSCCVTHHVCVFLCIRNIWGCACFIWAFLKNARICMYVCTYVYINMYSHIRTCKHMTCMQLC